VSESSASGDSLGRNGMENKPRTAVQSNIKITVI